MLISNMTDRHLRNAIAYLQRTARGYLMAVSSAPSPFRGDEACASWDSLTDKAVDIAVEGDDDEVLDALRDFHPAYQHLLEERSRREGRSRDLDAHRH